MIFKRHLLTFGPPGGLAGTEHLSEDHKRLMSMGEDEEKEVLPQDLLQLRNWWKQRLGIR
jgi:hypothetical protein